MDTDKRYVVIGASGDVGRGVTVELMRSGARVIAVGRSAEKLRSLQADLAHLGPLDLVAGNLSTEEGAADLRTRLDALAPRLSGVIVSINAPFQPSPLRDMPATHFLDVLQANLVSHFIAAKIFVPALPAGGRYIAIGGGMADRAVPGFGAISACQAAQRAMLKVFAREQKKEPHVHVHELMLHSMIAGATNRDAAQPNWLTDEDVGRHVLTMLEQPDAFTETVVNLRSRQQVGLVTAT